MRSFAKLQTQRIICCLVAVRLFAICRGSTDWRAHDCFTCRDKVRCPNIVRIFGPDDSLLFERDSKDKIPNCSGVLPLTKNCSVCNANSNIIIYCPNNIQRFDAEMDGMEITNISEGCEEENTDPEPYGPTVGASQITAHTGLLFGVLLFIMLG